MVHVVHIWNMVHAVQAHETCGASPQSKVHMYTLTRTSALRAGRQARGAVEARARGRAYICGNDDLMWTTPGVLQCPSGESLHTHFREQAFAIWGWGHALRPSGKAKGQGQGDSALLFDFIRNTAPPGAGHSLSVDCTMRKVHVHKAVYHFRLFVCRRCVCGVRCALAALRITDKACTTSRHQGVCVLVLAR